MRIKRICAAPDVALTKMQEAISVLPDGFDRASGTAKTPNGAIAGHSPDLHYREIRAITSTQFSASDPGFIPPGTITHRV